MNVNEALAFHAYALEAMTQATQGIEQVSKAIEVLQARGGTDAIAALKYPDPQPGTPEALINQQIDDILSNLANIAPVATALDALFKGTNRSAMMKLRTDV